MGTHQLTTSPLASRWPLRLRNAVASAAVVAIACTIYSVAPYNRTRLQTLFGSTTFSFTGADFLSAAAVCYTALLTVYFLLMSDAVPSKSLLFLQLASRFARSPVTMSRLGLSREDRLALLATLLKAFFGPLMVMSLMSFCMGAVANGAAIAVHGASNTDLLDLFDQHGFWFLMQLIFFVDVLCFTVGYLVETPRLGNQIRSVDTTVVGWGAALLCYPPFNHVTSTVLGSPLSDFPHFENPTAHVLLNSLMLGLMAIYASASVALGLKASNLTHRGIIARGPYGIVRHPAYTCKNMAWWIGSAPVVFDAFNHSTLGGLQTLASAGAWTMLYVLRALTEEDHLRSVDGDYAAYTAKVRYRFIPGVI